MSTRQKCPNTSDGQHCFHRTPTQTHPAMVPPEGGWPELQECKHCGQRRSREVEVKDHYQDEVKP